MVYKGVDISKLFRTHGLDVPSLGQWHLRVERTKSGYVVDFVNSGASPVAFCKENIRESLRMLVNWCRENKWPPQH